MSNEIWLAILDIQRPKRSLSLPNVLSMEEVQKLINTPKNWKYWRYSCSNCLKPCGLNKLTVSGIFFSMKLKKVFGTWDKWFYNCQWRYFEIEKDFTRFKYADEAHCYPLFRIRNEIKGV